MVKVKFYTDEWWPFYVKVRPQFESTTHVELEIEVDEQEWQEYEAALNTVINFQKYLHDENDKRQ